MSLNFTFLLSVSMPARWKTASVPSGTDLLTSSLFIMSAITTSKPRDFSSWAAFISNGATTHLTLCRPIWSLSSRCPPTKPVTPVTSIFMANPRYSMKESKKRPYLDYRQVFAEVNPGSVSVQVGLEPFREAHGLHGEYL